MSPGLVDLRTLAREAQSLKPLSTSALQLTSLVVGGEWEPKDVTAIVRSDQALAGRSLALANSVVSGSRQEIGTIEQAVVRMGPARIMALAVGSSVREQLRIPVPAYGLSEGQLWRHSIASSLAIDLAAEFIRTPVEPVAFVTALLHDIGKLVLARFLDQDTLAHLRRASRERGLSEEQAEREVLRTSHADLGATVALNWKLPELIADGIRYHHRPLRALGQEARRLCYQVALADAVAAEVDAGDGMASLRTPGLTPDIAGRLGIRRAGFEELCGRVEEQLEEVLDRYR